MALIFQYGSNMRIARLNSSDRLNGGAKRIGSAITNEHFRFCFPVFSHSNNCAASGIIVDGQGRKIFGALYEISDHLLAKLDRIEGVPRNYSRQMIDVDINGQRATAETYLPTGEACGAPTSVRYCSNILVGLGELSAPNDYVEYIVGQIETALALHTSA